MNTDFHFCRPGARAREDFESSRAHPYTQNHIIFRARLHPEDRLRVRPFSPCVPDNPSKLYCRATFELIAPLSKKVADALVEALKENRTLSRLEVGYSGLGEEACLRLSEVLLGASGIRFVAG